MKASLRKTWWGYAKLVLSGAVAQTWRDSTGSRWTNRVVQLLLVLAPVAAGATWLSFRPKSSAGSSFLANSELTVIWALTGFVAVAILFFIWHLFLAVPYQLWRMQLLRADKAECERIAVAPRIANLEAELHQTQAAAEKSGREAADSMRRLQEIRPYLEMLQAEHNLGEFDHACPIIEIPTPPKASGDVDNDAGKWGHFVEVVREYRKIPQQQAGMHGLNVLSNEALERIAVAGRNISPSQFRAEEQGVDWSGREALRMQWLEVAARLDRLRIEREDAKKRLEAMAKELTRAQKIDEILRLMPKADE